MIIWAYNSVYNSLKAVKHKTQACRTAFTVFFHKLGQSTKHGFYRKTICSLLEIFELTNETELRKVFYNLAEKIKME